MLDLLRATLREMINDGAVTSTITVGGFPLSVEIAATPDEQHRGLMGRRHLDPGCGMLFCYPTAEPLSFWMKDTHVPLSIAFIGPGGRVEEIKDLKPYDESAVTSSSPCRWALETHQGWFAERGLGTGAVVKGLEI